MNELRGGSVCTGVGGLDLGLERAGVRIVFQCEKDAYRRSVLARHWRGVPCFEDLSSLRLERGRLTCPGSGLDTGGISLAGGIDLLCGGTPCQDLSVAGRRRGLIDGERSSLFFEFARVADDLVRDGGWLLFENVPGLLSSPGGSLEAGRDFAVVLATLADIGFHDLAWRVLDSRYFGVPQRRRRVYIVARRAVGDGARQVLLEPESGGGDFAPRREAGTRVAASLAAGSHGIGVNPPGRRQHDDENIVGTLGGHKERGGWRIGADEAAAGQLVTGAIVKRYGKGTDSDATDALLVANTLKAQRGREGGGISHEETLVAHTLRSEGFDASEDGTGRGTPLVAGTVRSHQRPGSNDEGGIIVGPLVSRSSRGRPQTLSPGHDTDDQLVCAATNPHGVRAASGVSGRLDDPKGPELDPRPDGPRYSACGDAVTVNVAHWISERIVSFECDTQDHGKAA